MAVPVMRQGLESNPSSGQKLERHRRKPKLLRREKSARPIKLSELARGLPANACRSCIGARAREALVSRFAALAHFGEVGRRF